MLHNVAIAGLGHKDLPAKEPERRKKKVIYTEVLTKEKLEKTVFTPALQFSVKLVNYSADEFHSFIKGT